MGLPVFERRTSSLFARKALLLSLIAPRSSFRKQTAAPYAPGIAGHSSLFCDPAIHVVFARHEFVLVEEYVQLPIGRGFTVAAVDQIAADRLREVGANRPRRSGERIGRADQLPAGLDHALTFDCERNQWTARNEAHQVTEKWFVFVLRV